MTREDAARVLLGMDLRLMRLNVLYNLSTYIYATPGDPAILDGEFTADQLEAIATWMRDPTIADIKA